MIQHHGGIAEFVVATDHLPRAALKLITDEPTRAV